MPITGWFWGWPLTTSTHIAALAGRLLNSIRTGGREWNAPFSRPEITALVATDRGATDRGATEARSTAPPRGRAAGRDALTKNTKTVVRMNPFIGDKVRVDEQLALWTDRMTKPASLTKKDYQGLCKFATTFL